MNRLFDSIVKQAKRTGKRVAHQLQREKTATLGKLCVERELADETPKLRIWGPYKERDCRYRLKIAEHGVEKSLMFQSLDEAEAVKADLLQRHSATLRRTIGEVFDEWLAWCVDSRGIKPATVYCYVQISRRLPSSMQLGRMTESEARKLYQTQVDWVSPRTKRPASVATHHLFLRVVKNLWRWAIERGFCHVNPWSKIAPVGRRAVGKLQLRIDEARRFEAVALKQARRGDVPALGALLMIYLGLRQGEVVDRVARDIDDNGRVLWVPSGKTKNARRRLKIPEHLRRLVQSVAKDKEPDELLFYPSHHRYRGRKYYVNHVKRLCRLAGVPEVVPHSLRGLHATLALEGGATADAVAKALGHSSFAITEQHYASPSSIANNRASRVTAALSTEDPDPTDQLDLLLKSMSGDELSKLLSRLTERLGQSHPSDDIHPA